MHDRILVILPNNLGDVIMALPVLEGVRQGRGGGQISFLVEEGFDAGLIGSPFCDRIVRFPRRALRDALRNPARWRTGVEDLREFVDGSKINDTDLCINLSQHPYLSYLTGLIQANQKRGQQFLPEGNHAVPDDWSQYLYAIPYARRFNRLHAIDVYRRIAGVKYHCGRPVVALSPREISDTRQYLKSRGLDSSSARLAIMQPGAAYSSKRWPAHSFAALGRLLIRAGWKVAITGAPVEADLARDIRSAIGSGCISTAGETSFRQAIALTGSAAACVTGDTALMHAAAALNVPTFALFGPTNPVETGPYGDGHWILCGRCPQRPCLRRDCETMACLGSIAPETVFSCIESGRPDNAPGCDIYRTQIRPGGDLRIVTGHPESSRLWDTIGAELTLCAFGDEVGDWPGPVQDPYLRQMRGFTELLDSMGAALDALALAGDPSRIRAFETARTGLDSFGGIDAFFAAVLNTRLNSVPLLDAQQGVVESARVCRRTMQQIRRVLGE